MKKYSLILVCTLLLGCRAETNPNTPQNADMGESKPVAEAKVAEEAPAAVPAAPAAPALAPLSADKFHFLYGEKDPEIKKRFNEAANLVKEKHKETTALNEWSKRFGDWYIIQFELPEIPPERIPLDAPARTPDCYLVDLANRQVIEMGDWRAAKPFFDALIERFDNIDNDDEKASFVKAMASAASVVAFRHDRYIEVITGQKFPEGVGDPRLKRTMDGAELVYFIASTGMRYSITQCKLTIKGKGIAFESEIMQL